MDTETTQQTDQKDIRNSTVILSLTLGKPGNRKKVKRSTVKVTSRFSEEEEILNAESDIEEEVGPDQTMLHVSKDLLDSPELVKIGKFFGEVRRHVEGEALPTRTLKGGMYMLRITSIAKVNTVLKASLALLAPMLQDFEDVYPQKIQESMERLGDLSSPLDYPPIEKIRAAFVFEWQYLTFDVPTKAIGSISQELLEEEQNKVKAQVADFSRQIELALATSFKGLVDHLLESLRPVDGKKKKISDKGIDKFNKFFEVFRSKNVTEDNQLAELVDQAQALVNGATPAEINTDENLKDFVVAKMDEIKMNLDALVVERSERKIYLRPRPKEETLEEENVNHAA